MIPGLPYVSQGRKKRANTMMAPGLSKVYPLHRSPPPSPVTLIIPFTSLLAKQTAKQIGYSNVRSPIWHVIGSRNGAAFCLRRRSRVL